MNRPELPARHVAVHENFLVKLSVLLPALYGGFGFDALDYESVMAELDRALDSRGEA